MLITKNAAHKKENETACTVWEYDFNKQNLGLSCVQINGRYPASGKVVNTKCNLIYFVLSGSCAIHVDQTAIQLKQHDAFFLQKNKKYFVIGDKTMCMLVESPRWTVEQLKKVK